MGSVPTFSIELPKRKLPTLLASTSTATKTPICQELKLTSTTLKAGGVQMGDISQSASTIYRQQRSAVRIAYLLTCLKNFVPFFYIHSKSLLTNHQSKGLSPVMYNRMEKYLEDIKIIYNLQFGFRKKYLTEHALLSITEQIKTNFHQKNTLVAFLLNLKKHLTLSITKYFFQKLNIMA